MKLSRKRLLVAAVAATFASATAQPSQAGPWIDSILGRRPPAYPVGTPIPLNGQTAYAPGAGYVPPSFAPNAGSQLANTYNPYAAQYPTYAAQYAPYAAQYPAAQYPAYAAQYPAYQNQGYTPNQSLGYGSYGGTLPPTNINTPLLAPGFPQTVAGYLPTAGYDTQWARTPVTYYRPVTAFDPRYGTTVTSLQPCTSYQYQAQRQPVIAPRPLLGDYGFQANKWPAITGPGYNPTGLAVNNMYSPYQNIPNAGIAINGQANTFAPLGSSGTSLGMPATSLPATTMPYNQGYGALPTYPSASYYSGSVGQNPAYASSLPAMSWPNSAVGSGVIPSTALMQGGSCANGMCAQPQPATAIATPYVPGAVSVTPYGQPTYSPTPNNLPTAPAYGGPTFNPNFGTNPAHGTTTNPGMQSAPVLPPTQVLPGTSPGTPGFDPESMRIPFGGSSASVNPAGNAIEVRRLPMVAIDRGVNPNLKSNEVLPGVKEAPASSPLIVGDGNDSLKTPELMRGSVNIPSALPPRSYTGVQPLSAPEGHDSTPRWNPSLLDPEDRTALEQSGRLFQTHEEAARKIRLKDEDSSTVTAVAMSPKTNRTVIQLVSGTESTKSDVKEVAEPGFRPISRLK